MNAKEFGEYIKMLRIKKGYKSQRQLADASGISNGTIARIENGTQKPTADTLKVLAKFLDTDYIDLLLKAGYLPESYINESEGKGRSDAPHPATKSVGKSISKSQLKTFSNRLSAGIEKLGLSIESVANACRVSEAYIKELIHEPKQLPGVSTLYKLADLLDVTPDYLGGFTHDPKGVSPDTPKPKDLKEFLETQSVMYDGIPLTDEDKEKINMVLQALFLDAKKRNKRK
jgi:transcriptional regulator with XRE-family HTH domain